jgi:hypothetical protein
MPRPGVGGSVALSAKLAQSPLPLFSPVESSLHASTALILFQIAVNLERHSIQGGLCLTERLSKGGNCVVWLAVGGHHTAAISGDLWQNIDAAPSTGSHIMLVWRSHH